MALESASFINGLVSSNPADTDSEGQGSDHLRLIKAVLLATFPNLTGAMTLTQAALNLIALSTTGHALRFNGAVPVGSMHWFPGDPGSSKVARGGTATGTEAYIECDGSSYPIATFPDLGGSGLVTVTGSNFAVPLLTDTGRFLRSRTSSVAAGTSQANQFAQHTHVNTLTDPQHTHANVLADPQHTHTINDPQHSHTFSGDLSGTGTSALPPEASSGVRNATNTTDASSTGITINSVSTGITLTNVAASTGITLTNVAAGAGTETRPEAFVAVCCLKT